jgi:hypothetical protein
LAWQIQLQTLAARPPGARSPVSQYGRVKGLRRDIGTVRPDHSTSIHKELPEVCWVLEWLEDWTFQPWSEVNRPFRKVIEGEVDAKPTTIVSANHRWQKRHEDIRMTIPKNVETIGML